jgi:hypothetical protein
MPSMVGSIPAPATNIPMPNPTTEKNPLGAGIAKGAHLTRNEGVVRIQALAMMRELAGGKSLADVAVKFNTSAAIVRSRMNYAQRAGLFTHHEDVILRGMVPLAEDVLIERLMLGDKEVALEVYKGTGLFRKPGTRAPAATENDGKGGQAETLESHIAKLRSAKELFESTGAVDAEFAGVVTPPPPSPLAALEASIAAIAASPEPAEEQLDLFGEPEPDEQLG